MLDTNLATSFSRNTSLTETEVKEISGVQRIDTTADNEDSYTRIYGWMNYHTHAVKPSTGGL